MKRNERRVGKTVWLRAIQAIRAGSPEAIAGMRGSLRLGAVMLLLSAALVACNKPREAAARIAAMTTTTAVTLPPATPMLSVPTPPTTPAVSPTVSPPATTTAVHPVATTTPTTIPAAMPTVPTATAKSPTAASSATVAWATHADDDRSFKYPAGWTPENIQSGIRYRLDADGNVTRASIYARQAYRLGTSYYPSTGVERKSTTAVDYLNVFLDSWLTSQTFTTYDPRQTDSINGNPAIIQRYTQVHGGRDVQGLGNTNGLAMVIQKGDHAYFVNMFTREQWLGIYDPIFQEALRSFTPKKG